MREATCPQCQGSMRPVFVGEMQDKHVQCEYCGHLCDVPDEHSVAKEESVAYTDDAGREVRRSRRVTTTRRDLHDDVAVPGEEREDGVPIQAGSDQELHVIEPGTPEEMVASLERKMGEELHPDAKRELEELLRTSLPHPSWEGQVLWDDGDGSCGPLEPPKPGSATFTTITDTWSTTETLGLGDDPQGWSALEPPREVSARPARRTHRLASSGDAPAEAAYWYKLGAIAAAFLAGLAFLAALL